VSVKFGTTVAAIVWKLVLDILMWVCDKDCQWFTAGRWVFSG